MTGVIYKSFYCPFNAYVKSQLCCNDC